MKAVRYFVGVVGFLLVWIVVAAIIDLVVGLIFPPPDRQVSIGIGLGWRYLPGTIIGLLAGILSFRASIRETKKKDDK